MHLGVDEAISFGARVCRSALFMDRLGLQILRVRLSG